MKLLAVVVKETDFDTHSWKAVQTCLSLKQFPLNFPRTEVTSSSPEMGKIGSWNLHSIGLKSPEGNPAPPPQELAFLLGFFRLVLEKREGAVCYGFFSLGDCQG